MLSLYEPSKHLPPDATLEEKTRVIFEAVGNAHHAIAVNGRSFVAVIGNPPDVMLLFAQRVFEILDFIDEADPDSTLQLQVFEHITCH